MCRNIKTLFNFEPPATEDEVHASALQFVRKLSGFNKPSQANAAAFELAVDEVSQAARKLAGLLAHLRARARPRGGGREGAGAGSRALCLSCASVRLTALPRLSECRSAFGRASAEGRPCCVRPLLRRRRR